MAPSPESHIAAWALGQAVARPVRSLSSTPTVMGEGRPHTTSWEWLVPRSSPPQSLCLLSLCRENSLPGLSQSCFLLRLLVTTHMSLQWGGLSWAILGPSLISLLVSIMTLITAYKWQVYLCVYLTVVCLPHLTWSPMRLEILSESLLYDQHLHTAPSTQYMLSHCCLPGWLDGCGWKDGWKDAGKDGKMHRREEGRFGHSP